MDEKETVQIPKEEYEKLLSQLSKNIMLFEICNFSLEHCDDEYEKDSHECEIAGSCVYLSKAIDGLKNLEKQLKQFEK